jgi:hypothetical protein
MGSKQQVPDGMLIGPKNPIIEEALGDRLIGGKREAAELSVADFDGSRWKLVCTPDQPNVATVHLDVGGWSEIEKVGGREVLESLYAGMVVEPAPTYKVAVSVDCDQCQDKEQTLEKMILLKRHLRRSICVWPSATICTTTSRPRRRTSTCACAARCAAGFKS